MKHFLLGWVLFTPMATFIMTKSYDILHSKMSVIISIFWRIVAKDTFSHLRQVEKWGFSSSGTIQRGIILLVIYYVVHHRDYIWMTLEKLPNCFLTNLEVQNSQKIHFFRIWIHHNFIALEHKIFNVVSNSWIEWTQFYPPNCLMNNWQSLWQILSQPFKPSFFGEFCWDYIIDFI